MDMTLHDLFKLLGNSLQQMDCRWRETALELGLDRPQGRATPGGRAGDDSGAGGTGGEGAASPVGLAANLFGSPEAATQAGQFVCALLERLDEGGRALQPILLALEQAVSASISPLSPLLGDTSRSGPGAAGDSAAPGPHLSTDAANAASGTSPAANKTAYGGSDGTSGGSMQETPGDTSTTAAGTDFASGSSGSLPSFSLPPRPSGPGPFTTLPNLESLLGATPGGASDGSSSRSQGVRPISEVFTGLGEALALLHAAADTMDSLYSPARTPGLTGIPGEREPSGLTEPDASVKREATAGADGGRGAPLAGPEFFPPQPQGGDSPAAPTMTIKCQGLSVRAPSVSMQDRQRPIRDLSYELGRLVDNGNKGVF